MTDAPSTPWWRNDGVVFAALVLMAVIAVAVTFAVTNSYKHREDALARRWFRAGQNDLNAGRPKAAITDFRTALLYSRDNPQYRLRLAQALAENNQNEQAVAYFLNLWEEQPGNGLYNLELARLRARENRIPDAIRFYQGAIYGVWPEDPTAHRRDARIEFIRFHLQHNKQAEAEAEAISLLAEASPNDLNTRLLAADLLLKTGDLRRALAEFSSLVKQEPAKAALGAGEAAFALGHFRSAAQYFDIARQHGVPENQVQPLLDQAKLVFESDPAQRGLRSKERAERVLHAYTIAGERLQQCATALNQILPTTRPTTDLQQLYAEWTNLSPKMKVSTLARNSDVRESAMDLVSRIEEAAARDCGQPSGPDWALLALSRNSGEVQQ